MVFVLHLKATFPYACFCSENKEVDGFRNNELSMKPSFICKDPNLLMLSSEKIVRHHSNPGRENPEKNSCPDSAGHVPGPHRKIPGTVRVRVATCDIRVGPGQPQTRTRPGLLPSLMVVVPITSLTK